MFDTADTLLDCVRAFAGMLPGITVNREAMYRAASQGYATATDLADYLVRKGMPFRDAHDVVGRAVRLGLDSGRDLSELELAELQQISSLIDSDVFEVLTLEGSVAARNHLGGTAPEAVRRAIANAKVRLS